MFKLWLKSWSLFLKYEPKTWVMFARMIRSMGLVNASVTYIMEYTEKVKFEVEWIHENEEVMAPLFECFEHIEAGNFLKAYGKFLDYMYVAVDHAHDSYPRFIESLDNARVKHQLRVVA